VNSSRRHKAERTGGYSAFWRGHTVQFAEYIQCYFQLYIIRNDLQLTNRAAYYFTRNELVNFICADITLSNFFLEFNTRVELSILAHQVIARVTELIHEILIINLPWSDEIW
jgi:hypothetical protein